MALIDLIMSEAEKRNMALIDSIPYKKERVVEHSREGLIISIPINIFMDSIGKLKNKTLVYRTLVQIMEDREFFEATLGCLNVSPLVPEFFLFAGCSKVEIRVTHPLEFYK